MEIEGYLDAAREAGRGMVWWNEAAHRLTMVCPCGGIEEAIIHEQAGIDGAMRAFQAAHRDHWGKATPEVQGQNG